MSIRPTLLPFATFALATLAALAACGRSDKPAGDPAASPGAAGDAAAAPGTPGTPGTPATPPAPPEPTAAEIAAALADAETRMVGWRDRMCACANAECASVIGQEMMSWGRDQAARFSNVAAPVAARDRLQSLGAELAACQQKLIAAVPPPAPGKPNPADPAAVAAAVASMKTFRDQACACKDAPCAQNVGKAMVDWAATNAVKLKGDVSDEAKAGIKRLGDEVQACLRKATGT